jgi:hypothetical protein
LKVIHIANSDDGILLLKEDSPSRFVWVKGKEETSTEAPSYEEAVRLGWKTISGFSPLLCGYKFTLPERDEHGNNATFSDMVQSLNSSNGIYFDKDLGHNCIVHQIPQKSRLLYEKLKNEGLLQ